MTKTHILDEIRRTATANAGTPIGWRKFETETGIKRADWYGTHWARWGDAVREAGLAPNLFIGAYEDTRLLDGYARHAQELGRLPTAGELRLKRRSDPAFPNQSTFERLGSKAELVGKLLDFCRSRSDLDNRLAAK